jgi:hypothetical protein
MPENCGVSSYTVSIQICIRHVLKIGFSMGLEIESPLRLRLQESYISLQDGLFPLNS